MTGPAGMILFDKPQDWTSHDAVAVLRRMLPPNTKVGHCGTLDPLATGLLILLVGSCTRLQGAMQGLDKVYSGAIRFGIMTDTGDRLGHVVGERPVPDLDLESLRELLRGYCGKVEMPAPAYSAVKHKGKALYKYARQGVAVPAKLRVSRIYDWQALSYEAPLLGHRLSCSSGTYVRSLAEVLGRKVGCGATVECLRRESIAGFDVKDSLGLERLKAMSSTELSAMLAKSLPRLQAALGRPSRV
ncbi:MAG: tRNA pseudouridine(55) synthase TruB [Elusimicrobia bacterium]|nr:tRNA pseudouridine(55) synthase TruB [Elusimicrobiota bacterium]